MATFGIKNVHSSMYVVAASAFFSRSDLVFNVITYYTDGFTVCIVMRGRSCAIIIGYNSFTIFLVSVYYYYYYFHFLNLYFCNFPKFWFCFIIEWLL